MPTVNDSFAARTLLAPLGGSLVIDLAGNTVEGGESPYGAYRTAWFSWTCPDDPPPGRVKFGTLATPAAIDTIVGVYTGELGSLTVINENDDWPGASGRSQAMVDFPVAGVEYKVMLGTYDPTGTSGPITFSWSVHAIEASEWFVPAPQVNLVLDELMPTCFTSTHPTNAAAAQAGTGTVTQDSSRHPAGTSSNIGGGAGAASVQQMLLRAALSPAALHPVTPAPPPGTTLQLEYPTGVLYALYLRVDLFSDATGAPSTGGVVLQIPHTTFVVGPNHVARFLTSAELAALGDVRADIPPATTGPVAGKYTGALTGQFVPAVINSDGSLEYWFAVVSDVNHAGGPIPPGSAEHVWVISQTPTFPDNYPFSIRYSYQPPRYRWLTEVTYTPEDPGALVESAGEAASATSVRVTALAASPGSPSARAAAPRLSGPSRALGSTPPVGVRIYQPRAVFDQEPWIVAGGRAERAPVLGINARTWAYASAYDSTEGVEDALSVTLGATRRWVADPATFNTTTGLWTPAAGATGIKFKGAPDGTQYIDPGYEYVSRIGVVQRNAMVFAGGAYFTATGKMSGGDEWAISMVFVPHANTDSTRATILNSFQDDPDDPDNFQTDTGLQDLCLDITGDKLMIRTGGRQTYDTLRTISDRPIIVVISGKARRTRLLVVDRKYASHDFRHSDVGPTDMRLLLGRPNVEITRRRGTARMDLMEIATFNRDLGPKEMWQVASKLDSVYGVSR